jgi:hypothetical protein
MGHHIGFTRVWLAGVGVIGVAAIALAVPLLWLVVTDPVGLATMLASGFQIG